MTWDGKHNCMWPGCRVRVSQSQWGCQAHTDKLPPALQSRLAVTWRKSPIAHLEALDAVDDWIEEHEPRSRRRPLICEVKP